MARDALLTICLLPLFSFQGPAEILNPAKALAEQRIKARPLPLPQVRLLGGPLKIAQDLDAKYLLSLQPDRMLAFLRQATGLAPRAAGYGGWDGSGRQLTGHIAGHYLSAVSLMWAATGDRRFQERADYLVRELKEIQDKQGDGYLGALKDGQGIDGKVRFLDLAKGIIRGSGFDLNGLWSPWYVEHKIFAGLRDAYRHAGNHTALEVEKRFAVWVEGILSGLNEIQIQKMLDTEFGGMNEILVDLYADTGERRFLILADKFQHRAIIDPLSEGRDILAGKHGNTQVPKLLGSLIRSIYTDSAIDGHAARFFWEAVAGRHSFSTGGHGKNEYFGSPGQLSEMIDGRTAETCNIYNMLKLTRALFSVEPDRRYADFHERALFNHILASMDPEDGRTCYMVPVGRGVQHEYQNMSTDFTCCVGSGMESHALHGYGIYYETGNKLWVNLFAPSSAEWPMVGLRLEMKTDFPEGESATLQFTLKSSQKFTLALRRPYWVGKGFGVKINGEAIENPPADPFIELSRVWQSGDRVDLILPKTLRRESLPDNPQRMALLWGPLVLAGDLGPEQPPSEKDPSPEVVAGYAAPVFIAVEPNPEQWLRPVAGEPGTFQTAGVGLSSEVTFRPFYRLHRRRYAVYWDIFTPQEWEKRAKDYTSEQEKRLRLEAVTVTFLQPGPMQPERDFNPQGEETSPSRLQGRHGRRAAKWFSFDLPIDPQRPMTLMVTYSNEERVKRTFDILVDNQKIGEHQTERRSPEKDIRFFEVEYPLPVDHTKGKQKVTIRFQATQGNETTAVYGIRIIRSDLWRATGPPPKN